MEAADEEDRGLGEGHEKVADRKVDNEHVGGCPEASGPAKGWKLSGGASAGELPRTMHAHVHTCTHTHTGTSHRPRPVLLPSNHQPDSSRA